MLTLVTFLLVLSVLVLVHEFGHFIVGKLLGIGVEEFALGLPFTAPVIQKKLAGGMKLSLYPVLFGGFVKLLGEEGPEGATGRKTVAGRYFYQAGVWERMAVVVAGVVMNLLLAIGVFYLFLALSGFRVLIPRLTAYDFISPNRTVIAITSIAKSSPAAGAGLIPEEIILAADGREFNKLVDFQAYTKTRLGQPMRLLVTDLALGPGKTVTVVPRKDPPKGEGAIGVGINEAVELRFVTPGQKRLSGVTYLTDAFIYNLRVLASFAGTSIKTGNAEPIRESVSGPVGIAGAIDDILKLSGGQAILQLFNLLGLLSLSLAFMNILPFPALDGGRLAFYLFEAVTTKKIAARYENAINQIGLVILLGLMLLITFNDIVKVLAPALGR